MSGTSEKRYSVWRTAAEALQCRADYEDWDDAKREWRISGPDSNWRIWDHSTTPPTDVTDADPEAEAEAIRWWCTWTPKSFDAEPAYASSAGGYFEWDSEGRATMANAAITSATEPTFEAFAAAVKDATGVEIPVAEEPQWWEWVQHAIGDPIPGHWDEYYDQNRKYTSAIAQGAVNDVRCIVYGTTATRDAKRDRLLAAAREAGKP